MGEVYNNPATGHVFVEDSDGRLVWSTQRRPVNLLPQSSWLQIAGQQIAFDDFSKFVNYAHQLVSTGDGGVPWALGGAGDVCQTVTMIEPEDRSFPDITLGSVPTGVNYIDVRVRVSRTKSPTNFLDQSVPQLIAPAQWTHLPGGSCLIEATTVWRRLFEIVLVGSSVRLRRRQSVAPVPPNAVALYGGIYRTTGNNSNPWQQGPTPSYAVWGWVASAGAGFVRTQRDGHPAAHIQTKQFSRNDGQAVPSRSAKHPTRALACSINNSHHDFSSIYSADIIIRPGYIAP